MAAFDGELHLRLLGEQLLAYVSDDDPSWMSPLRTVRHALRAVGAITAETAESVLADYYLAAALRDPYGGFPDDYDLPHRTGRPPPPPVPPCRVVRCNRVVEHPRGLLHVRYVALSDNATTMGITFRDDAPLPEAHRGLSHRAHSRPVAGWGPPLGHLTDDQATTTSLEFTGSHDGLEWHGQLEAHAPLAPDTAWLEIDGEQLDLHNERPPPDVTVENVTHQDPAHRYLWRLAAAWGRPHAPPANLRDITDALIAAGALAAEDPCVDQANRVMLALHEQKPPTPATARALPEPWRSLVGRLGRRDGRFGTVPARTVTPSFDGITLEVTRLDSMPGSWHVEVGVVTGSALEPPTEDEGYDDDDDDEQPVPGSPLTWWARDDRGNAYLGKFSALERHGGRALASGRRRGGTASGRLEFQPPLDPKATHVDLMPTAETQRAVIRVPLRWRPLHGEQQ